MKHLKEHPSRRAARSLVAFGTAVVVVPALILLAASSATATLPLEPPTVDAGSAALPQDLVPVPLPSPLPSEIPVPELPAVLPSLAPSSQPAPSEPAPSEPATPTDLSTPEPQQVPGEPSAQTVPVGGIGNQETQQPSTQPSDTSTNSASPAHTSSTAEVPPVSQIPTSRLADVAMAGLLGLPAPPAAGSPAPQVALPEPVELVDVTVTAPAAPQLAVLVAATLLGAVATGVLLIAARRRALRLRVGVLSGSRREPVSLA